MQVWSVCLTIHMPLCAHMWRPEVNVRFLYHFLLEFRHFTLVCPWGHSRTQQQPRGGHSAPLSLCSCAIYPYIKQAPLILFSLPSAFAARSSLYHPINSHMSSVTWCDFVVPFGPNSPRLPSTKKPLHLP